jgi:transcription initiation factor TFIIIB Brf1 subunit/transcription initiation factor TFIIB
MEDTKEFVKGDREFKEILENHPLWGDLIRKTSNSDNFFSQFCTKLSLDFHVLRMSSILYNFHRKTLAQVIPKSAAAGCILYVCVRENITMTKNKISKELGVCIPTIVKVLHILEKAEEKRVKNSIELPVHEKVVTRMSKYNYDGKAMVALGKR